MATLEGRLASCPTLWTVCYCDLARCSGETGRQPLFKSDCGQNLSFLITRNAEQEFLFCLFVFNLSCKKLLNQGSNWNGFKSNNGLWSGKLQFHLQLDLFIVSPHTPPPTSFSTPSFPYPNPQPHNFNRTFVGLQSSSTEPVSCWLGRFGRPRKMFPWARLTFTNIETTGASIAKSLRSPRGSSYGREREECFSPHCGQVCAPEISLVLDNV